MSYTSPPGRHRHRCCFCSTIWEHSDDCEVLGEAHACPSCGEPGIVAHYEGSKRPEYKDHHLKQEGV